MTLGLCTLIVFSLWSAQGTFAAETPTQAEFDAAFSTMMENPGDLKATLHYANVASAMENYEAAIPALERVLFFNPELADIKLELGVMYYKLGSNDVARDYLNGAMAEGAPQDVVAKASSYLAAMGG